MDTYRHDSAYSSISTLPAADFDKLTSDETATYRSWRRAVLAFYCAVAVLGGFAMLTTMPVSHREVAQAMPALNVP